MMQTAIFPGRYVQDEGAFKQLGSEVAKLGGCGLIVAGRTAATSIIPKYRTTWDDFDMIGESFGGECSDAEISRLTEAADGNGCDVVIGVGGGKVIDTVKAVAYAAGARCVIVPTIASTDAPCSAVSVIYTDSGEFSRYLFLPRNPDLVLVDTTVIAEAPTRFLVAGMGDALATWFEADACRQAKAENQCGGLATLAGYSIARLCYDTILQHGKAAKEACDQNRVNDALSNVVEANTLLSGLGFESGGLAAAHSIHNGLTRLERTHDYWHGEKVAIGVLAGLFLAGRPGAQVEEAYNFCETVGLPTTLAEVGLTEPTDSDLQMVAEGACAEGETIYHEPGDVSPAAVLAALKKADQVGRQRKAS